MNQNINLIEPYLDEELSLEERNIFEAELQKDESLRKALAEEKATRATLYLMMTNRFRERAKNEQESAKIVTMQPQNAWRKWAIAAAIFGLIITAGIYLNNGKSTDSVALSEKYTFDFPTPQVQVAASEKLISDAYYGAIKSKDYDAALGHYTSLSDALKEEPNIAFFHAYLLLKKGQFVPASNAFKALTNPPEDLKEAIEWYSLMAQLGNGENIRSQLKAIADDAKHTYNASASKILEEMK
jgi:TPR repeat protein